MKERSCQKIKLLVMIGLTFSFFLVEIAVGYMTGSLALISDSFHMISDVLALIIGLVCLWLSTKESKTNTYGWARTEIIGALINSVFLIALCFSIFTEAIQRMIYPDEITNPNLLLIVGAVGLGVNLIGLVMFCNETVGHHGHSHGSGGGHGHSHGSEGHGHSHGNGRHDHSHDHDVDGHVHKKHDYKDQSHCNEISENVKINGDTKIPSIVIDTIEPVGGPVQPYLDYVIINTSSSPVLSTADKSEFEEIHGEVGNSNKVIFTDIPIGDGSQITKVTVNSSSDSCSAKEKAKKTKSGGQMNIQGVFLHILGDALGSVVVIISALLIKYFEGSWVLRVDPALSLLMVIIILSSTIPLFKQSALILLQNVPKNMNISNLVDKLKTQVAGISNVHDLHVWQLVGNRVIASMHVRCGSLVEYVKVSKDIKTFFHENGIHSLTIQPEFIEQKEKPSARECYLECGPDKMCFVDTCCSNKISKDHHDDQPAVFKSANQKVILPEVAVSIMETRF